MNSKKNKSLLNSVELLLTRQSNACLIQPAPNEADMDIILKAGMRVPDHAALMPWQFIVVQDHGLQRLSELFVTTVELTVFVSAPLALVTALITNIKHNTNNIQLV